MSVACEIRRAVAIALFASVALLQLGCDGGSDGPTAPPADKVSFAAARDAGTNSIALRRGAATQGTRLQLELVANGVQDLHTVSFVFTYPSHLLRFTGQGQGPFLRQGNTLAVLLATELPTPFGAVLVVDARPANAAGVSGSGVILTLELEALASGSGAVTFEGAEATDSQGRPIALDWVGGTATVAR